MTVAIEYLSVIIKVQSIIDSYKSGVGAFETPIPNMTYLINMT
jgi:hypothetical protein